MKSFLSRRRSRRIEADKSNTEQILRELASLPEEELFKKLESSPDGISSKEAEEKLDDHGENIITAGTENTVWHRLKDALINPFNIILLVIAVITLFTDVIYADPAEGPDYFTFIIILSLVFLSGLVAFIQSQRSNSATQKLFSLISNKAHVVRDGETIEIPMEDIVPGDIVKLSAGDMLPADLRFLATKDTFIAQAALTGESQPVEKFAHREKEAEESLTDIANIGFMGSNVISGSATALVLATGNDTYFGSMAMSLTGIRSKTSFERGVDSVSRLLVRMMFVMVPVVFLINWYFKKDPVSALLFAVSIAVGLTPEMLPVIMTSTLARGAVVMSKHDVIVRTLGAIQTFGEMDILCTDKTGTLTEDKIVLERYMNMHGDDDERILRHAFLNSHFQTGLKNLIDLAIINRANQNKIDGIVDQYERIDEIPFDFVRRRMSVVLSDKTGKRQLITKGAVEEMLEICSFVEIDGQVLPLDEDNIKMAMDVYEKHNSQGLRMVAVAQKNEVPGVGAFGIEDEAKMVLIGFVGFLDPPKESAAGAIKTLKENGVRTVVLTGDSEGVAI